MTGKQIGILIASVVGLIFVIILGVNMFTTVGAGELVVKQGAFDGHMEVWTTPGLYCQCLGRVTRYRRSSQYWFSKAKDEGNNTDESIKVRFSDGGHGTISGSLSYNLPTDNTSILKLHAAYGSMDGVEHRLIRQVVNKAVYMSGPFMSSRESSAERRPDLINFISDQISHGVYRTRMTEVKQVDILSGQEKTVRIVEPLTDPTKNGSTVREEASPAEEFGISIYNLTINNIDYDETVEKQIKAQQEATAAVQTQMAVARQAEQKLLTATSEGKAESEKAKWVQEVEKTKAVTAAEQERDVAKLSLETANLEKARQIAEGEGEAKRRRLIMESDGALKQKLDAWVEVNKAYAAAMANQPQVPAVVMGNEGKNNPTDIFQMMAIKTAKDLALDFRPPKGDEAPAKKK